MPFVEINGLTIPITGEPQMTDASKLRSSRTANNGLWLERLYYKRSWSMVTPLLDLDYAEALVYMLQGQGHHWSFNSDLYSDKGLTNVSGSWARASAAGKFGADYVIASTDIEIDFGAAYGQNWSVGVWELVGGTWEHHLKRSDGTTWEDGVEGTYAWAGNIDLDITGLLTLANGSYDDLVVTPYEVSDEVATGWPMSDPWGSNPYLRFRGDIYDRKTSSSSTMVEVGCTDVTLSHTMVGAAGRTSMKASVSFTIQER